MSANWHEKRLKLKNSDRFIDIMPGQILTSRVTLSKETGIHRSKLERILKAFENEQQIEQQTFTKYRVITILNWIDYQSSEQQNEQQTSNKRATNEQQMSTKKKVKKDKNNKKEEEPLKPLVVSLPKWISKQVWDDYLKMRIKIKKPLLEESYQFAFEKLAKLAAQGHNPDEVLKQSTFNSWQGLFEIKEKNNGSEYSGGPKTAGRKAGFIEANGAGTDFLG